ncbi:sugar phosphate isomerase/epimerase family protein [Chthonomonas calidirosea]|uniref:sugar phosphate isomerase/epimerase family protein n=1 Tax=Chthonomonas calidirosea TaxID=454171 RepID=UPI0006EC66E6|nr:sugar phosphate isomerase/epimerase family protein [Chthonomonas calidirosea]CEK14537.1 sugar phosphate isomerase/epimerase [Chthonomonas calidirosea]
MFVSIRDEIVFAAGYKQLGEGLKDLGFQAVELLVLRDDTVPALLPVEGKERLRVSSAEELAELKRQAESLNVQVCALCMGNNFNAADREAEVSWAVRTVEAAAQLGIPVVRIDPLLKGEPHRAAEEAQTLVVSALNEILQRTAGIEVDLGIENHGSVGNDPDFLGYVLSAVHSPRLGLTLDSGNFYWRGWPLSKVYAIFERFAGDVKHTHIKNIAYPEEIRESERSIGYEYGRYVSPIDEGDIDLSRYVRLLKQAGYSRDLCVEDESLGRYTEAERRANLRKGRQFLERLIQIA